MIKQKSGCCDHFPCVQRGYYVNRFWHRSALLGCIIVLASKAILIFGAPSGSLFLPESFADFRQSTSDGGDYDGDSSITASGAMSAVAASSGQKCGRAGDRYVKDYIQYECFTKNFGEQFPSLDDNRLFDDAGASSRRNLVGKALGCVPTNRTSGPIILPGATFTTRHFRFECRREQSNAVSLRVTHCIDATGRLMKLGEFRSEETDTTPSEQSATSTIVECTGDEFLARKVVHRWSRCVLPNGEPLVEGNLVVQAVSDSSRPITDRDAERSDMFGEKSSESPLQFNPIQAAEMVSCVRDRRVESDDAGATDSSGGVSLRCTGCVTTGGEQLAVTGYARVSDGQWLQCRRFRHGCRLINVTNDYIECQFEGVRYAHGSSFRDKSGSASYYCRYGAVIKQGCLVNGTLMPVGDVRYAVVVANDAERPLLCQQHSDVPATFNGLIGCDLSDGRFKRFLEVWRDASTMKRCSWANDPATGEIVRSQVVAYACVDDKEIVPLNKVVRRANGDYHKCASAAAATSETSRWRTRQNDGSGEESDELVMRPLDADELAQFIDKKRSKLDLVEYFGVGSQGSAVDTSDGGRGSGEEGGKADCYDMLPFCGRLSGYCNAARPRQTHYGSGVLEAGLAIEDEKRKPDVDESHVDDDDNGKNVAARQNDERHLQLEHFQRWANSFGNVDGDVARRDKNQSVFGCNDQLTAFQKFQALVEISCAKTCRRCETVNDKQVERLIDRLQRTSHCGR